MIVRELHGSGDVRVEPEPMLLMYCIALALSAGMSLSTCFTVFRWVDVKRDAGHGTMFMVFMNIFLWSMASFIRTCIVYTSGRVERLENMNILYLSIPMEIFFNDLSIWFMLVAYEIQRRALHPRNDKSNRRTMFCYSFVVYGVTICILSLLGILAITQVEITHLEDGNWVTEPLVIVVIETMSWGTWIVRLVSVLFVGGISIWLYIKRDVISFSKLPNALVSIVFLFSLLNFPYLIVEPLGFLGLIDVKTYPYIPSIFKCITFSTGIFLSLLMGLSVAGFDDFFSIKKSQEAFKPHEFFVISDSQPWQSPCN